MASIFVANPIDTSRKASSPTVTSSSRSRPTRSWWIRRTSARVLVEQHRDLIDAELAINEGGGGALINGKPVRMSVQHAEKIYQTYTLEVTDRGGHSASGRCDNAISRLADGLRRLGQFDFGCAQSGDARLFRAARYGQSPAIADASGLCWPVAMARPDAAPLRPDYNAHLHDLSPRSLKPATPKTRCRSERAPR
jgi:hypothetical protein